MAECNPIAKAAMAPASRSRTAILLVLKLEGGI